LKKIIIFILIFKLFAFEVEFTKSVSKYIIPNKDAVFIQTKAKNLTFPFEYKKTDNGYILFGDNQQIENYLNNSFYAPDDAKFKNIKIANVDYDKFQYEIIKKINNTYIGCNIKKIIFLSLDENKIITTPQTIKLKYKIILNCNDSRETKGSK